jgi:hypothetical protein
LPVPVTRNPFVGKGLRVTLSLLLEPREWRIRDLAEHSEASPTLTSMVVRALIRLGLVDGAVEHGKPAAIRGTRRLAREAARYWPQPTVGVLGELPSDGPIGGGPAHEAAGLATDAPPRRYVRSGDDARRILALWGGALVSLDVADYELCIVDAVLPDGLIPPTLVALELGATPRGRETLKAREDDLLGTLPR